MYGKPNSESSFFYLGKAKVGIYFCKRNGRSMLCDKASAAPALAKTMALTIRK